ncbi:MAG: hypothetical protein ABH821_01720 [archaeon]
MKKNNLILADLYSKNKLKFYGLFNNPVLIDHRILELFVIGNYETKRQQDCFTEEDKNKHLMLEAFQLETRIKNYYITTHAFSDFIYKLWTKFRDNKPAYCEILKITRKMMEGFREEKPTIKLILTNSDLKNFCLSDASTEIITRIESKDKPTKYVVLTGSSKLKKKCQANNNCIKAIDHKEIESLYFTHLI